MQNKMIEDLKSYVIENNLYEKASKDFWVAFNNWKTDCPKEYKKKFKNISEDDLTLFFHAIGLRSSEWPKCNYSHVTITLSIYHKDSFNESPLGKYVWWHSLGDPENDDDFLDI